MATYAAAKKKRKNKKKVNEKGKDGSEIADANGTRDENEADVDEGEQDDDTQQQHVRAARSQQYSCMFSSPDSLQKHSPTDDKAPEQVVTQSETPQSVPHDLEAPDVPQTPEANEPESQAEPKTVAGETLPLRNGFHASEESAGETDDSTLHNHADGDDKTQSETTARLDAMAKERDTLRAEVAELRQSLESIQGKHQEELSGLREEVEDAQSAKENAESQYRTLLGKVNTIRSQLGERLKADAVCLLLLSVLLYM